MICCVIVMRWVHCSLVLQCPLEARGEIRHGILFGAGGGSHSWDLWSVRRQHFRSAFCSERGEPLDRNNRHISRLLTKFAPSSVYVGADRLKLRRADVSPWMYAETFTFEWRRKSESVRPGLLLIASELAERLASRVGSGGAAKEKKGGARDTDTDTNQPKIFPSLWTQHPKVNISTQLRF